MERPPTLHQSLWWSQEAPACTHVWDVSVTGGFTSVGKTTNIHSHSQRETGVTRGQAASLFSVLSGHKPPSGHTPEMSKHYYTPSQSNGKQHFSLSFYTALTFTESLKRYATIVIYCIFSWKLHLIWSGISTLCMCIDIKISISLTMNEHLYVHLWIYRHITYCSLKYCGPCFCSVTFELTQTHLYWNFVRAAL